MDAPKRYVTAWLRVITPHPFRLGGAMRDASTLLHRFSYEKADLVKFGAGVYCVTLRGPDGLTVAVDPVSGGVIGQDADTVREDVTKVISEEGYARAIQIMWKQVLSAQTEAATLPGRDGTYDEFWEGVREAHYRWTRREMQQARWERRKRGYIAREIDLQPGA